MSRTRLTDRPGDPPGRDEVTGLAQWNALGQAKWFFWQTQAEGFALGASAAAATAGFKRSAPVQDGHQDRGEEGKGKR